MAELDPRGETVGVGGLGVRTPDLTGSVEVIDGRGGVRLRGAGGASDRFEAALGAADMRTTHVVELRAAPVPGAGPRAGAPGRSVRAVEPGAIELDVPTPSAGWEQAVLSVDEHGVATWSFAEASGPRRAVRGGGGTRTFRIKRTNVPHSGAAAHATRSVFGEVGKQLLKVVAFKIGAAVGEVGRSYLDQWEQTHQREYGVRDYNAANYTAPAAYFNADPTRWTELAKGRTLLFVHGTFSRAHGAFDALPIETITHLQSLYGDRVIAFDHKTISHDPAENIDWFLNTIPDGLHLDLDIVCHSRGGLVARSLSEYAGAMPGSRQVRVHRTALVGATNDGTILADVKHWNQLIDSLSTALNTIGVGVGDSLDLVLSFVRQVAVAAYPSLRGLACMVPGEKFLTGLNGRPRGQNEYLAVASNYEPLSPGVRAFFDDQIKDLAFDERPNDDMVRVDSVCGGSPKGTFAPVAETLILAESKGIEHSHYFGEPSVASRLEDWLGAGLLAPV